MLNELRAFLPMAEKVKARNPTMPILNHLCIENGAMRITDLETTIIIPVDDDRIYTLPISIMKQILKQRPAALEITPLEDYQMKVLFDGNAVVFPILDVCACENWWLLDNFLYKISPIFVENKNITKFQSMKRNN